MNDQNSLTNLNWVSTKIPGFSQKEMLDLTNGTVKLVKIAAGAIYPDHRHPDKTEYVYVVKGSMQVTLNEKTDDLKEGDFFIFPANMKHSLSNHTQNETQVMVGAIKI